MSQKRAFTLTIANGNQGRLQAANAAPPPDPAKEFEARLQRRAGLVATYAGVLGTTATANDAIAAMAGEVDAAALCRALQALGLEASVTGAEAEQAVWPALAVMTSGQVLLVLERAADGLVVYDNTCPDNRAHVALAEFAPFFGGQIVRAEASLAKVAETHRTEKAAPHWFWGQFGRFRRQIAEIAVGSFVANLLAVAVALFSLQVYDRVIPHQSEATLWVLAAGAALALLMEAAIKLARARLMDGAGRQIELGVLHLLMQRIVGMRSDIAGHQPNQSFSAMREFSSVREFFTASTVGTLADLPFIIVFLALVASIAGNVVWVLVLGGILMVVPGFLLQKRMIRLTEETQGASAKASRLLHETIFELDTLKTQRGEGRVMRLWAELNALSAQKSSEQRRLASALTYWSQGVQQATYVAAVITGTYLVFAGQFTVGSIIAVGILTGRTLSPLTQLAGTLARWGNVKTALDGLDQIAAAPQDKDAGRSYLRREALKGHFELQDVTFRYEADGPLSLDIKGLAILPGQKVAVLGANGSGKSSLLKVLAGLYAPQSGRLMVDGTEMAQIAPEDVRRLIGYLGQEVRLFAGTLRDNLNLTLLERDEARLMAALEFAGLGPFVRGHPKGLDLEIKDNGAGLSMGQRQSIGWARLWLQDPSVCLLDEPTAALDQTLEATLVSRLEQWMAGRTAVIATHRAPILALTDRTMVLQAGQMTIDGPKDQVLSVLRARGGQAA